MNETLVLLITSVATFSLTLISILSFQKTKENLAFFWLGMLLFSCVLAFVSNLLIYMNLGNALLLHGSIFFNLSSGGYLVLIIYNLRSPEKKIFKPLLFLPSAMYLPFFVYSFVNPQYVNEIVSGQLNNVSFAISTFYNLILVVYSLSSNLVLMISEFGNRQQSSQHRIRAEILIVMMILQSIAFVPFILKLNIEYVILYMPVFGQIFFIYIFFRLSSPGNTIMLLNPVMKKKYLALNTSEEKRNELERKIIDLMDEKRPFLNEVCTLQLIASEINESPHCVSMIINSQFNKSFPDFVNSYRIKLAIDKLQTENNSLTIEGIAFESGFGNKTSFYKAFKKETGKLPSEFLKSNGVIGCSQ